METVLPLVSLEGAVEQALRVGGRLDLGAVFPFVWEELWLEVGFGGGEHLAFWAERRPRVAFIGCEVFGNGIASLLRRVEGLGLANIRIFPYDARLLLPLFEGGCLGRVVVLFPDPWPKARHHKRRFICGETVAALARGMVCGGRLHMASDVVGYVAWMRECVLGGGEFEEVVSGGGVCGGIATRYEVKARGAGREPVFLEFVRL